MNISHHDFSVYAALYQQEVRALDDVTEPASIQQTVERLQQIHYDPTLIFPVAQFLSFSKADLLQEIERVTLLNDEDLIQQGFPADTNFAQLRLEQLGLLVHHFKLLLRLRRDDPTAWDEIDELYNED